MADRGKALTQIREALLIKVLSGVEYICFLVLRLRGHRHPFAGFQSVVSMWLSFVSTER